MFANRATVVLPILLITLGTGWILTVLGVAKDLDWPWSLGLLSVGLLTFIVGGIDKVTMVVGPLFIVASLLSILRQTGRMTLDLEAPVLVVITGVLMLLVHWKRIPAPRWLNEANDPRPE
jgi:hypothetical protein